MAWCTGLPTLAALLLFMQLSLLAYSAPVVEQATEIDSYYPVADSTGCYYNFQHYDEGDRIITNEPCLNCTCHNRMLMCYLRVCPFIKAIGENCKVEKRADQCCPIITCPEVPVQLLTSTTTEPSGATSEVGHLDTYGCSIDKLFYSDGARVPSNPSKPCELCYCIRNKTACVMQECTLHIQGCSPIYQEGVCCPVRYDCEHQEDSLSETTVVPAATTTLGTIFTTLPTSTPSDCVHDGQIFADGALIKKDLCDHCYCMKGDIVCAVQECGPTPLDKVNCTALPIKEGQCCPDTYDCENISEEELTTTYYELTTQTSIKETERTTEREIVTTKSKVTEITQPPEVSGNISTEIQEHEVSLSTSEKTHELSQERKPIVHPDEAITSAEQTTEIIGEKHTHSLGDIPGETVIQEEVSTEKGLTSQQGEITNSENLSDESTLSNEINLVEELKKEKTATTVSKIYEESTTEILDGKIPPKTTIESITESEQSQDVTVEITLPTQVTNAESQEEEITTTNTSQAHGEIAHAVLEGAETTAVPVHEESNKILPEEITTEKIKPELSSEVTKVYASEATEPTQGIQTDQPSISSEFSEDYSMTHTDLTTERQKDLQRTTVPNKIENAPITIIPHDEEKKTFQPPMSENIPYETESVNTESEKEATQLIPTIEPVTFKPESEETQEVEHVEVQKGEANQEAEEGITTVTQSEEKIVKVAVPETTEHLVEVISEEKSEGLINAEKVEEPITEVEKGRPEELITEEGQIIEKEQSEVAITTENSHQIPQETVTEKEQPVNSEITESSIQSATESLSIETYEVHENEIKATEPNEIHNVPEIEGQTSKTLLESEVLSEKTDEVSETLEEHTPLEHTLATTLEEENVLDSHTEADDFEHDGEEYEDHNPEAIEEDKEVVKLEHEASLQSHTDKQHIVPEKADKPDLQPVTLVSEGHSEEMEAVTEIIPSKIPDLPESQIKIDDEKETIAEAEEEQPIVSEDKHELIIPEVSVTPIKLHEIVTVMPPQKELNTHDVILETTETTEKKEASENGTAISEETHNEITGPPITTEEKLTTTIQNQTPETPMEISKTATEIPETPMQPSKIPELELTTITYETPEIYPIKAQTVIDEQQTESSVQTEEATVTISKSPVEMPESITQESESSVESSEHTVQTAELAAEVSTLHISTETSEILVDTTKPSEETSEIIIATEAVAETAETPVKSTQSSSETTGIPLESESPKETPTAEVETSEPSVSTSEISVNKVDLPKESPETTEETVITSKQTDISTDISESSIETESPFKMLITSTPEALIPITKSPTESPVISKEETPTVLTETSQNVQTELSETSQYDAEEPQTPIQTTGSVLKEQDTTTKLSESSPFEPEITKEHILLPSQSPIEEPKQTTTIKSEETSELSESPLNESKISEEIPEFPLDTGTTVKSEVTLVTELHIFSENTAVTTEIMEETDKNVSEGAIVHDEMEIITDIPQPTGKPIESFDHVTEAETSIPTRRPDHDEIKVLIPELQACPAGTICEEVQGLLDQSKESCENNGDCEILQENIPQVCANGQECKEKLPESTEISSAQSETETKTNDCLDNTDCAVVQEEKVSTCLEGQQCKKSPEEIACKGSESCKETFPVKTHSVTVEQTETEHEYQQITTSAPSQDEIEKEHLEPATPLFVDHTTKYLHAETEIEIRGITTLQAEAQTVKTENKYESTTLIPEEGIVHMKSEVTIYPEPQVQEETTEIPKELVEISKPTEKTEEIPYTPVQTAQEIFPENKVPAKETTIFVEEVTPGQKMEQKPERLDESQTSTEHTELESTDEKIQSIEFELKEITSTTKEELTEISTDLPHKSILKQETEEQKPQAQTELPTIASINLSHTEVTEIVEPNPTESNIILVETPDQVFPSKEQIPTQSISEEGSKSTCNEEKCILGQVTPLESEQKKEETSKPSAEKEFNTVAQDVEENIIPGEGSCLVDGQTYENNSNVPAISRCQISCKCISSILQCESVSCSPAPSNLENCMPIYHSPDSCCPTYSCTLPGISTIESDNQLMETTTKSTSQEQITEIFGGQGTGTPYNEAHLKPIEEETTTKHTHQTSLDEHVHLKPSEEVSIYEKEKLHTEAPYDEESHIKPIDELIETEKELEIKAPHSEQSSIKPVEEELAATEKEELETEAPYYEQSYVRPAGEELSVTEKEQTEASYGEQSQIKPVEEESTATNKEEKPTETSHEEQFYVQSVEEELVTTEREELQLEMSHGEQPHNKPIEKEPTIFEKEELHTQTPHSEQSYTKPVEEKTITTDKEELETETSLVEQPRDEQPIEEEPATTDKKEIQIEASDNEQSYGKPIEEEPTATGEVQQQTHDKPVEEELRVTEKELPTENPLSDKSHVKPIKEEPTTNKVELETEASGDEQTDDKSVKVEPTVTEKELQTETPPSEQSYTKPIEGEPMTTEEELETKAPYDEQSHVKSTQEESTATEEGQQTETPSGEQSYMKPVDKEPTATEREEEGPTETPHVKPIKEEQTVTQKEKSQTEAPYGEEPHISPDKQELTTTEIEEELLHSPIETELEYVSSEEEIKPEEQMPAKDTHEKGSGQDYEVTTKSKSQETEPTPTKPTTILEEVTTAIEEHTILVTTEHNLLYIPIKSDEKEVSQEYTNQTPTVIEKTEVIQTDDIKSDNEILRPSEQPEYLISSTETSTEEETKKEVKDQFATTAVKEYPESQKEITESSLITKEAEIATEKQESEIGKDQTEVPLITTEALLEKLSPAAPESIDLKKYEKVPSVVETEPKQSEVTTELIRSETEQEDLVGTPISLDYTSTESEQRKPTERPEKEIEQTSKLEPTKPEIITETYQTLPEFAERESLKPVILENETASPELIQETTKKPQIEQEEPPEQVAILTEKVEEPNIIVTERTLFETSVSESEKTTEKIIESENEKPLFENKTQKLETEQTSSYTESELKASVTTKIEIMEVQTIKNLPEVTEKPEVIEQVVHIEDESKDKVTSASHMTEDTDTSESENTATEETVTAAIIPVTEIPDEEIHQPEQTEASIKESVATLEPVKETSPETPKEPSKEITPETEVVNEKTQSKEDVQYFIKPEEPSKKSEATNLPEEITEPTTAHAEISEIASEKTTEKSETATSEEITEEITVTVQPVIEASTQSILKHDLYTSAPHPAKTTYKSIIPGELQTSAPLLPSDLEPILTTLAPHYYVTSTTHAPNYEFTQSTKLPESPHEHVPESYPPQPDEDYDIEEPAFGPGTCRYGGKVYVSAQQIPRDDPCDFCFCFRSDIICLQQSCPPPIPRCHEEPIRGFCCPRYECPVNMATSVNITTTTTTTTTTLPPHFLTHAYRGKATKTGCLIQGQAYKVGEVIRSASGPCLHCVCGGDGQMQCDPKVCSPEPILRQMIEATASSRR